MECVGDQGHREQSHRDLGPQRVHLDAVPYRLHSAKCRDRDRHEIEWALIELSVETKSRAFIIIFVDGDIVSELRLC